MNLNNFGTVCKVLRTHGVSNRQIRRMRMSDARRKAERMLGLRRQPPFGLVSGIDAATFTDEQKEQLAAIRERFELTNPELGRVKELIENPPAPTPALVEALAERRAHTPASDIRFGWLASDLLGGSVARLKLELHRCPVGRLAELAELERAGKNRKGAIEAINAACPGVL